MKSEDPQTSECWVHQALCFCIQGALAYDWEVEDTTHREGRARLAADKKQAGKTLPSATARAKGTASYF